MSLLRCWLLVVALLSGVTAHAEKITVAAAADLKFALEEIVTAFSAAHPADEVTVIYGSSGKFHAQIRQGAPYDLYFSADIAYPRALQKAGFAASGVKTYAFGRIVVWSPGNPAEPMTLAALAAPNITRVAIANPRHAPYGKRAVEALQAAVSAATARYQEQALILREQRQHVAASLAPDIAGHLRNLGMPDTQVEFAFIPLAKPGTNGLDDIELLFTANKGQTPQPLAKVVSGGELSRFALSVQVIQAQHSAVPVLVFDEVDVGISGGTAEVVGQLLRMLGERAQILCITHQPQVAAKGHQHWRVENSTKATSPTAASWR